MKITPLRTILGIILAIVIGLGGPYLVTRLRSAENAVSIFASEDPPGEPASAVRSLRVGAWNIAHARGPELGQKNSVHPDRASLDAQLQQLAETIRRHNLDLVVLNEVDFDAHWSHGVNQAARIAELAGYPYRAEQRNFDVFLPLRTLRFGNAVLSRFPIEEAVFVPFAPLRKTEQWWAGNHEGLLCRLSLGPETRLNVFAVHLEYRDEPTRLKAAARLRELRSDRPGEPWIALGDFNSTLPDLASSTVQTVSRENTVAYLLDKAGWSAAGGGSIQLEPTFPALGPDRKLDWILGTGGVRFHDFAVAPETLSDHRLIVTGIELSEPR